MPPPGHRLGRLERPADLLHELAPAEHPLVSQVGLPPPAKPGNRAPAPEAPDQAAALEFRPPPEGNSLRDEGAVGCPRPRHRWRELPQDGPSGLPGAKPIAQERAMPGPGVPVQRAERGNHLCPERVQVQVPDEFEEVGFLLHHDGLVAVLEEVADPLVPPVEGARIAGEQRTHAARKRPLPRPGEEVGVIGEEGPSVDGEAGRVNQSRQPADEVGPVCVVPKDGAALESSHHHVVEDSRSIKARLSGHLDPTLPQGRFRSNVPYSEQECRPILHAVLAQGRDLTSEPLPHLRARERATDELSHVGIAPQAHCQVDVRSRPLAKSQSLTPEEVLARAQRTIVIEFRHLARPRFPGSRITRHRCGAGFPSPPTIC